MVRRIDTVLSKGWSTTRQRRAWSGPSTPNEIDKFAPQSKDLHHHSPPNHADLSYTCKMRFMV
ncbi:hypothetical protein IF1G_09984 [Cordyceps javanica]|uniref:Uncharacterized protein n=1 Tax=Cordyceps javanica TaxID=43265 RepID=A0A545UPU7_9HYPO|nr:hypothetical protein IF1G_09984 [Cordyceps javanica]